MHGKWHDTFCPMGPCILSADVVPDPQALPMKLTVNGQVKQDASTAEMVFPVPAIVAFLVGVRHASAGGRDRDRTRRRASARPPGHFSGPATVVRATIGPIGTLENPVEAEEDEDL